MRGPILHAMREVAHGVVVQVGTALVLALVWNQSLGGLHIPLLPFDELIRVLLRELER